MNTKHLLAVVICLSASAGMALTESEPNGSRGSANGPVIIGDTITGSLTNDGEGFQDYFSFNATAGQTIRFVGSGGSNVFPLDLGFDIENASGTVIASKDANGDNQGETLDFTAPSSSTYYLVVYEATGTASSSSYSVSTQTLSGVNDWNLY